MPSIQTLHTYVITAPSLRLVLCAMCRMSRPWRTNVHLGCACSLSLEYDYVNRTEGIPSYLRYWGCYQEH